MRIEILSPGLVEAYNQYLLSKNFSLFYYGSKYKNFLGELLGCKEEYLLAMDGGTICGILPLMYTTGDGMARVYNSLPYYGSNGGIIADNTEVHQLLADFYNRLISSPTVVSATVISNPLEEQNPLSVCHNFTDYRISQLTNISCQNDFQAEIFARIDSSARRNVKKAIREGVTVETDSSQIERLREMHQENMRAIGGIPKTDKFFSLISKYFIPGQDFDLYVAKKDGIIVAGLLLFYFNQTVEYFTPAIDNRYRSIQPLSLIIITAMADAARRGFKWWNWGGTWISQTGVYRFKKKWAAIEEKYFYYTQLNDLSILNWPREKVLSTFPNFFVVPFSSLNQGGTDE